MPKNIHAGHRSRLRDRFMKEGLDGFSEHEMLELLLTYAIPQRDVNPLAHALINRFGSLSGVLDAGEHELMQVDGVGKNAASLLCLMPALLGAYQRSALGPRPLMTDLANAKAYAQALYLGIHEERAYMLCLDQSGHVICPVLLYKGSIDRVPFHPRDIVEAALRHHAYAVILIHNHPGGTTRPSKADYDATQLILEALSVIGIRLLDHLIFAGDELFSLRRSGDLETLPTARK